jgi:isoleucyl-tRNA synthetase
MDAYNIPDAMSQILPFVDDASNWFVRRSRRRFWKSEDDGDKEMAYRTLHYVLVRLSYVLAPFTPFLAEELYQNMTGDKESVHLKDWMPAGHVNELVMNDMEEVRRFVTEGLSLRAKSGLKVRQPLASVTVPRTGEFVDYESILKDELNVKAVKVGDSVAIDEKLTPELKREGLMREVVRVVQSARKKAGLNVDDRISLVLSTDDNDLQKAIDEHAEIIKSETLAEHLTKSGTKTYVEAVKVEGSELKLWLEKA